MPKIHVLGGAREVGKSSFEVTDGKERYLLDCGINVQDMSFPKVQRPKTLDGIFLSHAHVDHSGYIPALYKKGAKCGVWSTNMTFELSDILLRDSIKVQMKKGLKPHYMKEHVKIMNKHRRVMGYGQGMKINNAEVEMQSAGHIPGSTQILLTIGGKRILYTGDIKFIDTELSAGAYTDYKDIDLIVSESTYSYKDHPDRKIVVSGLREHILEVLKGGGNVLLPVFAVGRTQEMVMNLFDIDYPIYVDGMGVWATKIMLKQPGGVRNWKRLKKAFGSCRKVRNSKQRKEAIKKPSIIISTAGMMQAGASQWYAKKLANDERNAVVFTGYQVDGTPGRNLLETGRLTFPKQNFDIKPKFDFRSLDFSDHTDKQHLIRFYNKVKPKKIMLIHGDQCETFAEELKSKGFDAFAPKNGDTVKV